VETDRGRLPSASSTDTVADVGTVLFALFVVIPFVDLLLLLRIGALIGFWPTVFSTIAIGMLGAWLAKREGLRVVRAWRQALQELRPPSEGVIDGVLVVVGGALLVTPGLITDLIGLLFLVPLTRRVAAKLVRRWVDRRIARSELHVVSSFDVMGSTPHPPGADVVDTQGESIGEAPELPRRD
jgi:UPF0716 protein FxsA